VSCDWSCPTREEMLEAALDRALSGSYDSRWVFADREVLAHEVVRLRAALCEETEGE
jgi:hypothetical protein